MSTPTAAVPVFYKDTLAQRAASTRYRNIGNPYAFLSGLGIDPILEAIYKGGNIVDVARELNISITILLNWLEQEGHMTLVEKATTFSAEGYISEATTLLRNAQTDFDLKKADKLGTHARFLASKLNRNRYGQEKQDTTVPVGVTFIMHMGDKQHSVTTINPATVIEHAPNPLEITQSDTMFSITPPRHMFRATDNPDVAEPDQIGPFEPEPLLLEGAAIPAYLRDLT